MANKKRPDPGIKNNLQKYRIWQGLALKNLGAHLQVSQQLLGRIEHGHYPKYQVRKKICDFFNVSHNQMFYKEDVGYTIEGGC